MYHIEGAAPVVIAFVIGGLLGYSLDALIYLVTGGRIINPNFRPLSHRNHTGAGNHAGEVELAITQDPLAWPVGREWAHLDGAGRHYIISRVENLGSISVIGVGQVQQWRVYGKLA